MEQISRSTKNEESKNVKTSWVQKIIRHLLQYKHINASNVLCVGTHK